MATKNGYRLCGFNSTPRQVMDDTSEEVSFFSTFLSQDLTSQIAQVIAKLGVLDS